MHFHRGKARLPVGTIILAKSVSGTDANLVSFRVDGSPLPPEEQHSGLSTDQKPLLGTSSNILVAGCYIKHPSFGFRGCQLFRMYARFLGSIPPMSNIVQ
jgi:hypothetical protein